MQLLTWFSRWIKLLDGDELVEVCWWSKLRWARCNARRALSSWASLSSSTNFICSDEGDYGDDGGVGLWLMRLSWWAKRVVSFWWLWGCDKGMDEHDSSCVNDGLDVVCEVLTMMLGLLFWEESLVWKWGLDVGWFGTTSLVCWQESSFLLQMGLTEIFATLENLGFWLLGEDMLGWMRIYDEERYL